MVNKPLKFKPEKLYVPGIFIGTGVVTTLFFKDQIKYKIAEQRNKHFGSFHTRLDDYMEYASLPIAYGLMFLG